MMAQQSPPSMHDDGRSFHSNKFFRPSSHASPEKAANRYYLLISFKEQNIINPISIVYILYCCELFTF